MKISAKTSSLMGQAIMAVWIAGWASYAFVTGKAISMSDIALTGVAIAGSFSPTYVSIWLDKIKDIRFGGSK